MRRVWALLTALAVVLVCAAIAQSQSTSRGVTTWHADENFVTATQNSISQIQQQLGTFLAFGNSIFPLSGFPPANGQALCDNAGVIGGCAISGPIQSHTLTFNSNITLTPTSSTQPVVDTYTIVLSANLTTITLPGVSGVADSEIMILRVLQPSIGGTFNFTIPSCLTSSAGTHVVITNGVAGGTAGICGFGAALPTMPTGISAEMDINIHYTAVSTAFRVEAASQ